MTDAFGPTKILHSTCSRVIDKCACRQTDSRHTGRRASQTDRQGGIASQGKHVNVLPEIDQNLHTSQNTLMRKQLHHTNKS